MKKRTFFTPPPKKSDNLVATSFYKFLCLSSCAIIGLISLGCSNVTAQDQASTSEKAAQISSFSDYSCTMVKLIQICFRNQGWASTC